MKPTACKMSLALVLLASCCVSALPAQTINGYNPSGPAVSPYLNLMRPATLPGINYYGLVRPQLQFQSAITNLQQGQAGLMQDYAGGGMMGGDMQSMTGHPVMFGNTSHYFAGSTGTGGMGLGGGLMLPGARNVMMQRSMNSPLRGLGGMGMMGLGGMGNMGMSPGASAGGSRSPR